MKYPNEFALGTAIAFGTMLFSLGVSFFIEVEDHREPEVSIAQQSTLYGPYLLAGGIMMIIPFLAPAIYTYLGKNRPVCQSKAFDSLESKKFSFILEGRNINEQTSEILKGAMQKMQEQGTILTSARLYANAAATSLLNDE